jgi:shikimate kinase
MTNNQVLRGVNVYLIGLMGVGKTTIGKELTKELGYAFIDTDEVIAKAAGRSVSEIFAQEGEAVFRQLETEVLQQICAYTKLCIATGGGIVLRKENWSYLRHGAIVWLDAPLELLCARLTEDTTRPILQNVDLPSKLKSLLSERQALYAQADLRITIQFGDTPEQIAQRILAAIPSILKKPVTPPNSPNSENYDAN